MRSGTWSAYSVDTAILMHTPVRRLVVRVIPPRCRGFLFGWMSLGGSAPSLARRRALSRPPLLDGIDARAILRMQSTDFCQSVGSPSVPPLCGTKKGSQKTAHACQTALFARPFPRPRVRRWIQVIGHSAKPRERREPNPGRAKFGRPRWGKHPGHGMAKGGARAQGHDCRQGQRTRCS